MTLEFTSFEYISNGLKIKNGWYMIWVGNHNGERFGGMELISYD